MGLEQVCLFLALEAYYIWHFWAFCKLFAKLSVHTEGLVQYMA